jgi:23S rRNA (adenine2030-N6)-methyltransferase
MKYRHAFHAGNFADVHKHVTLLALLAAMKRKDTGFLYLESHAGRGCYDLADSSGESAGGIGRLGQARPAAEELRELADRIAGLRASSGRARLYPGSPLLAATELRAQDRAILVEHLPAEARALERTLARLAPRRGRVRVELGDGFERLRALLPPRERRALILIDPPYEESRRDFERARGALEETLGRFRPAVVVIWYPIKDERDTRPWLATLAAHADCELLCAELWLYPRDSRVALNGSGIVIANPPFRLEERMRVWLPELHACLDAGHGGGTSLRRLGSGAAPPG